VVAGAPPSCRFSARAKQLHVTSRTRAYAAQQRTLLAPGLVRHPLRKKFDGSTYVPSQRVLQDK
jgi:NADH:ubiquinone oxidoreductase subunit C